MSHTLAHLPEAIRVAVAAPQLALANPAKNAQAIIEVAREAAKQQVSILTLPELCLTGYSVADLLWQSHLHEAVERALLELAQASHAWPNLALVVGAPLRYRHSLYNCAVVIQDGQILAAVPKQYLPNSGEYQEQRWFNRGAELPQAAKIQLKGSDEKNYCLPLGPALFEMQLHAADGQQDRCHFAIEICEDLWVPQPPSTDLALLGAELILNCSASVELVGKDAYRRQMIEQQSGRLHAAYLYSSSGPGESSMDLVFCGRQYIAENGHLLASSQAFSEGKSSLTIADIDLALLRATRRQNHAFAQQAAELDIALSQNRAYRTLRPAHFVLPKPAYAVPLQDLRRPIRQQPFVPSPGPEAHERCQLILDIQAQGLARRLRQLNNPPMVLGISGGLDSTLALLVCREAAKLQGMSPSDIVAVTMPGQGTSSRTYLQAQQLMQALQVSQREISIKAAVLQHFADIGHPQDQQDVTYENAQARERTQILMDVANQLGGIVIGTGDLSELALGWCTYNGDHMSMYGVNASVPKTLVRSLVQHVAEEAHKAGRQAEAEVLEAILATPISPELLPPSDAGEIQQSTEDKIGPYLLHDFFLYYLLRYGFSPERILALASVAFSAKDYPLAELKRWLDVCLKRFTTQQFKRSCLPDGPKVGAISLSPRGDWRMPSDADAAFWWS